MTGAEMVFLVGSIGAFTLFAVAVAWADVYTSDVRAKYVEPK